MKKVLALVLAVAMVLSLSAVSFAAFNSNSELIPDDEDIKGYIDVKQDSASTWSSSKKEMSPLKGTDADMVAYGKTVYFAILVADTEDGVATNPATDSKQVAGLKVTPKWTDGEKFVKSVEIVKKGGNYYVAVATTGSDVDSNDLSGKIYLKGYAGTGSDKHKVDGYFNVDLTLAYAKYEVSDKGAVTMAAKSYQNEDVEDANATVSAKKLFVVDDKVVYDLDDLEEDEYTVYFGTDTKSAVASIVVDVNNEDDVLLAYDVDEVEAVADAYPEANLDYVALTGTFKKTGEVTVYADEGTYLYKVVDGKAVAMDAEYDEWEEGFVFKTKTLGTYVISDVELKAAATVTPGTTEGGNTTNPSTGAAL